MRRPFHAAILLATVLLAGPALAQHASSAPPPAGRLPDVALPVALDRVLRDYERAWSAGDGKALAALFAEDGFILQSHQPPVRGRDAIAAAYAGQGGSPLRLRALAYSADGSTAYIIGAYTFGGNVGDTGKFTLTLTRAGDGPWLIFSDMDNGNAPPRAR
ncbi:YybH family protein [Stenotrophomonas maltophilia]|uniref:YybH family protein n=1 Tax=Stenotrophomonas maltophilia TaxID=40324 RepID=UPI002895EAB0|nr:nuclear transport factor 2 family protein [Stenotrophomonas maltophilia]MDT3501998.1 nuclear transport factor 2 family protein [Stenotrophomonas maltophilia]